MLAVVAVWVLKDLLADSRVNVGRQYRFLKSPWKGMNQVSNSLINQLLFKGNQRIN